MLNHSDIRDYSALKERIKVFEGKGIIAFQSCLKKEMFENAIRELKSLEPSYHDVSLLQNIIERYNVADKCDMDALYAELSKKRSSSFHTWIGDSFEDALYSHTTHFKKAKRTQRRMKYIVFISVLILISGGLSLALLSYRNIQGKLQTQMIQALKRSGEQNTVAEESIEPVQMELEKSDDALGNDYSGVLPQYRELYNLNPDLAGWLTVDALGVDLPVMQGREDGYYLSHSFMKEYDYKGSLFVDPYVSIAPRSKNIVIYGHNMKNGDMFGNLKRFETVNSVKANPVFSFDTIYEEGDYEIISVIKTHIFREDEEGFRYYQFYDYSNEDEFRAFHDFIVNNRLYDIGIEPEYGDEFVILSTCEYSREEGRLLIVGRRVS